MSHHPAAQPHATGVRGLNTEHLYMNRIMLLLSALACRTYLKPLSLIHREWVISLNLFHNHLCSAGSSDPLPGLLLLWGAGRHGGVAASGPSHPPPHPRTKPQLRLEGDAPARLTSVWSELHRTLIVLSSRGQQRPPPPPPLAILKPFLC